MTTSERKIKMVDINEMITCKICSGYLIDATTIVECLHTFCKSCIVKHLNTDDNNTCPQCDEVIHQSHPMNYIKFDRTMQDIVYKLVPNLETDEYTREREFYKDKGIPCPKDVEVEEKIKGDREGEEGETGEEGQGDGNQDYHSSATITLLKKFIALKCLGTTNQYREIDILCDGEYIPKDHTLKFVYITRWRTKPAPLKLVYSPKLELEKEIHKVGEKKSAKKSQAPQWKLQPKLNYDDDDDES